MQCYDAMGGAASPDCPDSKAENKLDPDNFLSAVKYNLWKNISNRNTQLSELSIKQEWCNAGLSGALMTE